MHLPGYPVYFVKGSKRRAVYYTAEARDLKALGWQEEEHVKAPEVAPAPLPAVAPKEVAKPEVVEVTIENEVASDGETPDFEFMTKPELLAYALERGVDLPNNSLKAELVEACKKLGS